MTSLVERIKSRGWWLVVIRPTRFDGRHIAERDSLWPLLERCVVSLRGWNFPHTDQRPAASISSNAIGQDIDWEHHLETRRFYQSGQFVHLSGLMDDWRDRLRIWPATNGWRPCAILPVVDTVSRLSEICEFAARLALGDAGDERMYLEVRLGGLADRALRDESRGHDPVFTTGSERAGIGEFVAIREYARDELIADARSIAGRLARDLFQQFGWNVPSELLDH